MTVDYPGAIDMIITSPQVVFTDMLLKVANQDMTIINHKTACGAECTATQVAQQFGQPPEYKSAHFVVGRDGSVIQCVQLKDGAGANCCVSAGYSSDYYDPLMAKYGSNVNWFTISIEHEDWSSDNSQEMTDAQITASNKLNLWLCERYNIGWPNIHSHASIDPVNRARCPGPTFDFNQLFTYIDEKGKPPVPPNRPSPPTGFKLQQFQDIWKQGGNFPLDSAIAQEWMLYSQDYFIGPPTCAEFQTVDWNGQPILMQLFGGGAMAQKEIATGGIRWWLSTKEITFS